MEKLPTLSSRARYDAAIAFLEAYFEGRPLQELHDDLPNELEATGQFEAARIVRSFFHPADPIAALAS